MNDSGGIRYPHTHVDASLRSCDLWVFCVCLFTDGKGEACAAMLTVRASATESTKDLKERGEAYGPLKSGAVADFGEQSHQLRVGCPVTGKGSERQQCLDVARGVFARLIFPHALSGATYDFSKPLSRIVRLWQRFAECFYICSFHADSIRHTLPRRFFLLRLNTILTHYCKLALHRTVY